MKKILLSLGAAASIIAPVATVVACGDPKTPVTFKVDVTKGTTKFAASNEATIEELSKGLPESIKDVIGTWITPLVVPRVNANNPAGPKSALHYNYSGAIGIMSSVWNDMLDSPNKEELGKSKAKQNTFIVTHQLLSLLLLNKEILTNNTTQNLNTQATAQSVYNKFKAVGVQAFEKGVKNATDLGLVVKAGQNAGKKVQFTSDDQGTVSLVFATA